MRRCRAWAACGLAIGALATAACSGDVIGPEPVVTTEKAVDDTEKPPMRAKCVAADPEGEVILHPGSLRAVTPIHLIGAELRDSANLEIIETIVVPYDGSSRLSGVVLDYPPLDNAALIDSLVEWDDRMPLENHVLRREDGQIAVMVAVRLEDPEQSGRLDGLLVESITDGDPRFHQLDQPLLIQPHGELCTIDAVAETTEWAG